MGTQITEFPADFVSEVLHLLDRIEVEDDASLSGQWFDIAEKYGLEVVFGPPTSAAMN